MPKSLKPLHKPTSGEGDAADSKNSDETSASQKKSTDDLDVSENIEAALDIIANKKTKVERITLLLFKYFDDILDADSVEYFKNIKKLKKSDSATAANSTASKGDPSSGKSRKSDVSTAVSTLASTPNGLHGEGDGQVVDEKLSASLAAVVLDEADLSADARNAVERFEKERMSAPNPFIFIVMLKVFLAKLKDVDCVLQALVEKVIEDRRIMED